MKTIESNDLASTGMWLAVLGILTTWSFATPIGSSPDDSLHLPSIWCSASVTESSCKRTADGNYTLPTVVSGNLATCYTQGDRILAEKYKNTGICTGNYSDLSVKSETNWLNQVRKIYPPFFYEISGFFVSKNVEHSIWRIRLFWSIAFITSIFAMLLFSAKIQRANAIIPLTFFLSPSALFIISSTNPTSGALTALLTSTWSIFFATNYYKKRNKVSLVAFFIFFMSSFAGIGMRTDTIIFLICSCISVMLVSNWKSFWIPMVGVFVLVVQNSIIRNVWIDGNLSKLMTQGLSSNVVSFDTDLLASNLVRFPEFLFGFWGYYWGLGWKFEPPLSNLFVLFTGALGLAVVWQLISAGSNSSTAVPKAIPLRLVLRALSFCPVPVFSIYMLQISGAPIGQIVQPRYLLPYFLTTMLVQYLSLSNYSFSLLKKNCLLFEIFFATSVSLQLHTFAIQVQRVTVGWPTDTIDGLFKPEWWWPSLPITPFGLIGLNASFSFALVLLRFGKVK